VKSCATNKCLSLTYIFYLQADSLFQFKEKVRISDSISKRSSVRHTEILETTIPET